MRIAKSGGEAAGEARKAVESRTGVPVITSQNAAQLNSVVTNMIESVADLDTDTSDTDKQEE